MSNIPPKRNLRNVVLFKDDELSPLTTSSDTNFIEVSLEQIILPPQQPRRYFDEIGMGNLISSIKKEGILQPLLVRKVEDRYELVAGERRYRAAKTIGLLRVPVFVKQLTEQEAQLISLTENLQREDLNPVEETEGILSLLSVKLQTDVKGVISYLNRLDHSQRGNLKSKNEEFQSAHNVMGKQEINEIFEFLGLTWQSFLKNRLPLLKLPNDILETLRAGKIAYTKAKMIAKIEDESTRKSLLEESITLNWSLSQIRERINQLNLTSTDASIDTPQKRISDVTKRLKKSQVWKDTKKWRKAENLLKKLEALLEED
ncbi:ParB/RepB/Spo0J family partition protein [Crocosphaera sp. Alani8]|uniref:ParB/RepB/Spo0J family partition protein n=1 Tax=Crocosphaera sp. Alani8 TaxID=3038952 RepID=UPI00313B749C